GSPRPALGSEAGRDGKRASRCAPCALDGDSECRFHSRRASLLAGPPVVAEGAWLRCLSFLGVGSAREHQRKPWSAHEGPQGLLSCADTDSAHCWSKVIACLALKDEGATK
ncbi:hypothetical protein Nmel_001857, partial [Mimus melanotis]